MRSFRRQGEGMQASFCQSCLLGVDTAPVAHGLVYTCCGLLALPLIQHTSDLRYGVQTETKQMCNTLFWCKKTEQ